MQPLASIRPLGLQEKDFVLFPGVLAIHAEMLYRKLSEVNKWDLEWYKFRSR